MAWDKNTSLERIRRYKASVPENDIHVEDFASEYLPLRAELAKSQFLTEASTAIVNIPRNRAILTDGVHVYADLMDFGAQLTSEPTTEASFRRALQFLHLHYGACDRLLQVFGMQRVDFHGARLHAVVLTPVGDDGEFDRIARAIAFANAFSGMVERTGNRFGGRFRTRVSVGIDTGKAIAINSGRGDEHEPLFIGRPANHAAHLAANGQQGIHLSEPAQAKIAQFYAGRSSALGVMDELLKRGIGGLASDRIRTLAEASAEEIDAYDAELQGIEVTGSLASFNFHYFTPPLRSLVFADHPPSNAILMEMGCVFADIDGFTNYVDQALMSGKAKQAVSNLHVMRGELAATSREDFDGRKVRFIGDCLQSIIAVGDAKRVDPEATIERAVLAAGGMRSSFELCQAELPGIQQLGLAIGLDYGVTPACRIGLRGEGSVRCVTSPATCQSEAEQQRCRGHETAIGERAFESANLAVRRAFGHSRIIPNLAYGTAVALLHGLPTIHVNRTPVPAVQAHSR